ncbi:hypothetical protein AAFF_G00340860 [Aldrovandia affinis]|uniref:Uncharacterized protein n=1 Tax=Aldrovandia affinis TaxID=143900 RepID=A0AAD7SL79_9TELE|nr:hypothetical protein AAFF_G00340860 [Aldrovandia affinis]
MQTPQLAKVWEGNLPGISKRTVEAATRASSSGVEVRAARRKRCAGPKRSHLCMARARVSIRSVRSDSPQTTEAQQAEGARSSPVTPFLIQIWASSDEPLSELASSKRRRAG